MTASPDANDVLFGSNSPTAKFELPGTTIGGTITSQPRAFHEREYDPNNPGGGDPKYFKSGDPIMGITIDVQTQLRDPSLQNDNGIRTIYVQGKRLKDAIRDAVHQAGSQKLEVGSEIYVTFTHLGTPPSAGSNAPKEYAVRYVPVAQAAIFNGQQPAQAQQVYQQPVIQQAPVQQVAPVAQAPLQQPAPVAQVAPAPAGPPAPTQDAVNALLNAKQDPRAFYPGIQLTADQQTRLAAFAQV